MELEPLEGVLLLCRAVRVLAAAALRSFDSSLSVSKGVVARDAPATAADRAVRGLLPALRSKLQFSGDF